MDNEFKEEVTLTRQQIDKKRMINRMNSFINKINILKSDVKENNNNNAIEKRKNFLLEFFTFIRAYLDKNDYNKDDIDTELYFKYFLKLIFYDYIIFLPNNFFIKKYILFKKKQNFLLYLEKYNVIYFLYEEKNLILSIMGYLNNFIKNTKEDIQKTLIKKILIPNINFLENNYFEGRKHVLTKLIHQMKFKEIYFQDSIIEPNILYKKISFSNQELFLNLNQYSMKRVEYKLRSFCQIAEELGAQLIDINYNYIKNEKNDIGLNLKTNAFNIGGNFSQTKDSKDGINLKFEYPSNHIHINLNKYNLINKIIKENQFLISKDEFESDVELKYLIDARCTSFIQKYNTQFTVESCNFIEKKLYIEAQKYGINFDSAFLNNHSINLSIYVEFFPLIENPHIIDGTNLHILREGFLFLIRLIDIEINLLKEQKLNKEDELNEKRKIYRKLIQYIKTHIYAIENNWIDLNFSYYFQENVSKIFKQMIEKNFKQEEFEDYIINYFQNHLGWSSFINLRNTLLKGDLSTLDKLSFVSTQYMDILIYKKTIIDSIFKNIEEELYTEIINFLMNNIEFENLQDFLLEKIKNDFFKKIQNLIIQVYRKSFYVYNGLSNNQDYESLKNIMYHLLIYNFENLIFDINKDLQEESIKYYFKNTINIINLKSKISVWIDNILKYLNINNFFVKEEISPIKNTNLPSIDMELVIINKNNKNNKNNNISPINTNSPSPVSKLKFRNNIIVCTSLIDRQRKYFIKYIIKYFQYNHQMDILLNYCKVKSDNTDEVEFYLYNYINDYYSLHKNYSNYIAYRLFFSYDDFEDIVKNILLNKKNNKKNNKKKIILNKNQKKKIIKNKKKFIKKRKFKKNKKNKIIDNKKNKNENNENESDENESDENKYFEENRLNTSILYIFKYIYNIFIKKK